MKVVYSALANMTLILLTGCGSESSSVLRDTGDIDCAIEIQIAVRSQPYREGEGMNAGDFYVASSNVFPIRSAGGPGHVISKSDGVIMEIEWSGVQLRERRKDQHHSFKNRISFDDFRFQLINQVLRPDGTSHGFGSGPGSMTLGPEFDVTQGPVTFSAGVDNKESALVVRARLLPGTDPVMPLAIVPGPSTSMPSM